MTDDSSSPPGRAIAETAVTESHPIVRGVLGAPRRTLVAIALASIPFALGLGRLEIRSDGAVLHPSGNAVVESTRVDRDRFRDAEAVYVLVARRRGGDLFDREGLAFLETATDRFQTVPGVWSDEVLSITNAIDVTRSSAGLRVTRHLEAPLVSDTAARHLRQRLREDRIYEGFLFGRDGRSALIEVPLVPTTSRLGVVHRLDSLARELEQEGDDLRLTGPVVAEAMLGEQILADLVRLVPIVVVVVAGALALCLRQVAGVVVPLLQAGLVLSWTLGAMALLGVPLTLVTSILPVLLMSMAVTDVLHLLERFQTHHRPGTARAAALALAIAEVGPAIARSSVTTAIGFLSFVATSVPAVRQFGAFAGLGLALAMGFAFTAVPALLLVVPPSWLGKPRATRAAERARLETWAVRHPRVAAAIGVVLVALALTGFPRIAVEDSWVGNFSPSSDLVRAERVLDREYHGSYRLDLVLESARDRAFLGAEGLARVDAVARRAAAFPEVSAALTHVDLLRVPHQRLAPERDLRELDDAEVASLLLMFELAGDRRRLDGFVTPDGREARIQCFVRGADSRRATSLLARVDTLRRELATAGVGLRAGGDLAVANEVVHATVANQLRSVGLALLGLWAALAISFASISAAAVVLVPVLATTAIVLGGMGHVGMSLGVATSMFASLAEGEGANFGVHVVTRLRRLWRAPMGPALEETFASVGTALRWNAAALAAGCLVLCFSALRPVRSLGALLGVGMVLCYAMTCLFVPILARWARPRERDGSNER